MFLEKGAVVLSSQVIVHLPQSPDESRMLEHSKDPAPCEVFDVLLAPSMCELAIADCIVAGYLRPVLDVVKDLVQLGYVPADP